MIFFFPSLNKVTEGKGLDGSDLSTLTPWGSKEVSLLGCLGVTLELNLLASLLCLLLCRLIRFLASNDFLLAFGWSDMLNAHMDALLQNFTVDRLVDADSNSRFRDVEHNTGSAVVVFVGHALVDRGISENIDIVTHFHVHEVLRQLDGTMLAKLLREHVARARAGSV